MEGKLGSLQTLSPSSLATPPSVGYNYCTSISPPLPKDGETPCRNPRPAALILITSMALIFLVLAFLFSLLLLSHFRLRHMHSRRRQRSGMEMETETGMGTGVGMGMGMVSAAEPQQQFCQSVVLVIFPGEEAPSCVAKPRPFVIFNKVDDGDDEDDGEKRCRRKLGPHQHKTQTETRSPSSDVGHMHGSSIDSHQSDTEPR